MLIAMLGICSKEELDEEDEDAEDEIVAEGEEAEPELTGSSPFFFFFFLGNASLRVVCGLTFARFFRGRDCGAKSCDQEQDLGGWQNVENLLGAPVRLPSTMASH